MRMNTEWLYGLIDLSFWGYVIVGVASTQLTLIGVTLYLHRDATHRSLDLHPALRHFFRLWIWMTSGILTREWVAVHRKHHLFADKAGDPHSPVNEGLRRILLEGSEFYQREALNRDSLAYYGRGTPDDWLERRVYTGHRHAGIVVFVVFGLVLFGVPGIILIAAQMLTMPILAAGAINGFGHSVGYRTYEVDNASTNIVPWGIIAGGEELHNNHHAFPSSAKFSVQPWEFDLGWLWVVILKSLGLAKVNRIAPRPIDMNFGKRFHPGPSASYAPHSDVIHAVIRNRMHVLRAYATHVVAPLVERELGPQSRRKTVRMSRKLLTRSAARLDGDERRRLHELLETHPVLKVVHDGQEQLRQLWETVNPSRERLVGMFAGWCARAEASGIEALGNFAATLRNIAPHAGGGLATRKEAVF